MDFHLDTWDGTYPATLNTRFVNVFQQVISICQSYDCYIAGGAARAVITGEPTSDIDLYFTEESSVWQVENDLRRRGTRTIKRGVPTFTIDGVEVQCVTFRTGFTPQDLLKSYDFTCCQIATNGRWVLRSEDYIRDQSSKTLRFTEEARYTPANLLNRFWRIQKYLDKGYNFAEGEAEKYFRMAWNEEGNATRERSIREMSSRTDQAQLTGDIFAVEPARNRQLTRSVGSSLSRSAARALEDSIVELSTENPFDWSTSAGTDGIHPVAINFDVLDRIAAVPEGRVIYGSVGG